MQQLRLVGSPDETEKPRHTKQKGDEATAFVIAHLTKRYTTVLLPFGENQRYDLVVEDKGGRFLKVQCKMGRLRKGAILFNCCSVTYHHPSNQGTRNYKHSYRGQIDYFGVYCADTGTAYLIPESEVGTRQASLRFLPPKNSQSKFVRWAADYEI